MEPSGAELARVTRRRLYRAAAIANGLGGLAVFAFGNLAPGAPDPDQLKELALANGITFVVFMAVAFPLGIRHGLKAGAPIERWLLEGRPATVEEQELALRYPVFVTKTSAKLWVVAICVFVAISFTVSPRLAASDAIVGGLGGTICCAMLYLLAERATRPVVARALAGRTPPRSLGASVAARLTMVWALVSGVPLAGIAAIVAAELAGASIDTLTTAAMLLLAVAALVAGLATTVVAARAVGDPVRDVQRAMEAVEQGSFDTRVAVDDASEVGRLQAGFNRMAAGLGERERLHDLFGRHVGRDVAAAALDGELRLGGEEREVAALFVDLVGSTSLAARRPPGEVVDLLNAFFHLVVEATERHGGWVNKFEGDAALCVFGAPTAREDPAGDALAAARELRSRLSAELPELDSGIGVSAGRAVAGNVGAEHRFEYTVIGDPVNEAARLCELAKRRAGRVLASGAALDRARSAERARWALGEAVELRGRDAATVLAAPA